MNQSTMRKIILFIQILFVIGCAAAIYMYVQAEVQPKKVYIYNKDLEANTILTKDDITDFSIPSKAITKDFETKEANIVNKYLAVDVVSQSFVYKSQLVEKDGIDKFKSMDKSDLRLMTIPVSYETAVGGQLKKGDKIDLLFVGAGTYKDAAGIEHRFAYSKAFLQNVDVYALNNDDGTIYEAVKQNEEFEGEGEEVNTGTTGELSMITLAVTVEQAEEIEARLSVGDIRLLNRFADSKSYQNKGYVIGEFDKIYSGSVNGETDNNKIVEDKDF